MRSEVECAQKNGKKPGRPVLFAELVRCERTQQIIARNDAQRPVLVEGTFLAENFGDLQVEAGVTRELTDAVTTAPVKPRMILTLVLAGEVRFAYDGQEHVLKVNPQRQSRHCTPHQAVAVNLRRLTVFRRRIRRGEKDLQKIQIMVNPAWWQRGHDSDPLHRQLAEHLLDRHLAHIRWQPPEEVLIVCRELLALRHETDNLRRRLRAENLAHQILWAFIMHVEQLPRHTESQNTGRPQPLDSTARAISYLEANLHAELCLDTVAKASAMSVSALQRHFRRDTGLSVFEYVRSRRLEKVRDALCQDAISVTEAAYMAGYNHTSNFITAFRRQFGITPGEVSVNDSRSL